jgi:hypothetical protein
MMRRLAQQVKSSTQGKYVIGAFPDRNMTAARAQAIRVFGERSIAIATAVERASQDCSKMPANGR